MPFSVRFYGTSAAVPSLKRGFACIGLAERIGGEKETVVLLDCGDRSINKILAQGTSVLSISDILVSHFHSDHLSGLAQIVETMGLNKRTADLNLYGSEELRDYFSTVERITRIAAKRTFQINIHETTPGDVFLLGKLSVSTFEMDHTITCIGYRITSHDFVLAYSGDTQPCDGARDLGKEADLFIHEATFLEKDKEKARQSKHSTPKEAAETASNAGAGNLVLTHVNDSYESEEQMLSESANVHPNIRVAHDGLEIRL